MNIEQPISFERRYGPLESAKYDFSLPRSCRLNPIQGCQVRARVRQGQTEIVSAWIPWGPEWSIDGVPHAATDIEAIQQAEQQIAQYLRNGATEDLKYLQSLPIFAGVTP